MRVPEPVALVDSSTGMNQAMKPMVLVDSSTGMNQAMKLMVLVDSSTGMIQAMKPMVLVDGNNVMGSRPDGWWRNRAQAAQRLVAEIAPVARSHGGAWTVVFDGPEPAGMVPPHECLAVVHTGHGRRDGADDRIVELVGAIPDPATALVYTSDAGLRARVHVLGARVAGARTLLEEIATVGTRWSER